jgi:hypothetical protein
MTLVYQCEETGSASNNLSHSSMQTETDETAQQVQKTVPGILSQSFAHTNIQLTTPWSRVLLENLSDFQLVKKLPALYRT